MELVLTSCDFGPVRADAGSPLVALGLSWAPSTCCFLLQFGAWWASMVLTWRAVSAIVSFWCECSLVEFSRLLAPGRPRFRASSHVYLSALAARRARRPSRSSRGQATLPKYELRDFAWKNS